KAVTDFCFQAKDGIRDRNVTGVQTCALPILGIRVDEDSMVEQLKKTGDEDRLKLQYHKMILNKELPYTIGGGIGQSRLCMLLLRSEERRVGKECWSQWCS